MLCRKSSTFDLRPFFPFLFILILMIIGYIYAYFYPLTWENLRQVHLSLKDFDNRHPLITSLLFICIYILYALLSLPGIFILSLVAGFLFHQPFSTLYVIIAATIGASLLFAATRTAFGGFFYKRSGHFFKRLEKGFSENAASYLLCLRLIPLFPFWVVNFAGAFFGTPFWVFVWTTFIGMIPSVLIYTQAGSSLSLLLEYPGPLNPAHLFNANLIIALMGLAVLSLLPVLFHYLKEKS